jgi:hypothetical protein
MTVHHVEMEKIGAVFDGSNLFSELAEVSREQ